MNPDKIRKSGYSILITIIFLVLLVLLNVFTSMLTERFFLKVDITDTGLYTLSDNAAEFLGGINETVDIIVLSEESTWRANTRFEIILNILKNYSASSGGNLQIQFVNPDLNSFVGSKYNNSLSDLKEAYTELEDMGRNDIIFLSSRRATLVQTFNLFAQGQDNFGRSSITGVRADQEFISALIYVLNEQIARLVFIDNHFETPMDYFKMVFERSGYISSTINLALEDIPEDTIVLVSAAPKYDFLSEEILKLEQYLALGGNLIILYDTQLTSLPLLDGFLSQWGIATEDKLIFDEDYTFIPQFGVIGTHVVAGALPSTINAELLTTNVIPVGIFNARPLREESIRGGFNIYPLVQTFNTSSYAKDISSGSITTQERESIDESGPFVLAYNVRYITRNAGGDQAYANLIYTGVAMFDDAFLSMFGESFYNSYFISDLATDMNPFGDRVFFPAKEFSDDTMLVSAAGARAVLLILVILVPILIITTGIVIWRKRRHK